MFLSREFPMFLRSQHLPSVSQSRRCVCHSHFLCLPVRAGQAAGIQAQQRRRRAEGFSFHHAGELQSTVRDVVHKGLDGVLCLRERQPWERARRV